MAIDLKNNIFASFRCSVPIAIILTQAVNFPGDLFEVLLKIWGRSQGPEAVVLVALGPKRGTLGGVSAVHAGRGDPEM